MSFTGPSDMATSHFAEAATATQQNLPCRACLAAADELLQWSPAVDSATPNSCASRQDQLQALAHVLQCFKQQHGEDEGAQGLRNSMRASTHGPCSEARHDNAEQQPQLYQCLVALGGRDEGWHSVDKCTMYNPQTDLWRSGPPLPQCGPFTRAASAAGSVFAAGNGLPMQALDTHKACEEWRWRAQADAGSAQAVSPQKQLFFDMQSVGHTMWQLGGRAMGNKVCCQVVPYAQD